MAFGPSEFEFLLRIFRETFTRNGCVSAARACWTRLARTGGWNSCPVISILTGGRLTGFFRERACGWAERPCYGAEFAEFDGGSFTMDRPQFSWTVYGGRSFTYFSDPNSAPWGVEIFCIGSLRTSVWNTIRFITSAERTCFDTGRQNTWFFTRGFRMVGSYPTDSERTRFGVRVMGRLHCGWLRPADYQ